jgi:hypothetical protein
VVGPKLPKDDDDDDDHDHESHTASTRTMVLVDDDPVRFSYRERYRAANRQ